MLQRAFRDRVLVLRALQRANDDDHFYFSYAAPLESSIIHLASLLRLGIFSCSGVC